MNLLSLANRPHTIGGGEGGGDLVAGARAPGGPTTPETVPDLAVIAVAMPKDEWGCPVRELVFGKTEGSSTVSEPVHL